MTGQEALIEALFSVLYAPIFMLIQTRQLADIVRGRDSGWAAQRRQHQTTPWLQLCRRHGVHMLVGVAVTVCLAEGSVPLLLWMSPTLVGLVLAVPLSALSERTGLATVLARLGLLSIPEEIDPPRELAVRASFEARLCGELGKLCLDSLLSDASARDRHFAGVLRPTAPARGIPDLERAAVELKLADAADPEEALSWLSARERLTLLMHPDLFDVLIRLQAAS